MEWLPTARVLVANLATPALRVEVPIFVVPFLKVTVPVGVPENVGCTVAVRVTNWPKADGFGDAVSPVVVLDVIEKLAVSVPSTLPATSVLWNVTVLTPAVDTVKGAVYVVMVPPLIW